MPGGDKIRRLAARHARALLDAERAGMEDALAEQLSADAVAFMRDYNCQPPPAHLAPTAREVAAMADAEAATRDEAADSLQAGHDPFLRAWVARHLHIMDMEP